MKENKLRFITQGALIGALYVLLTYLANMMGLASGVIQFRLSEALYVLACFTPAAVPGLWVGCMLSNILTGGVLWDVIFGSLATLIGAWGARMLRHYRFARWVAPFPPIVANAAIVPFVLRYAYGMDDTLPFMIFTVSVGEIATCGALGVLLYGFLARHAGKIGLNEEKDAAPGAANNEKI